MKISIIITTKNEEYNISRLLKSILKIKNEIEVIVIDAGSTDKTCEIAKNYDFVKLISAPSSLRGGGRNIGIKKSSGDVIVFLDADTELTDEWYSELVSSMKRYDIVAGYSPDPEGRHLPRVPIYVNGQDITYPTCNIAYKREIFEKVGYFREEMITAEDVELNYRCVKAGYLIFYNPKMIIYHYQRTTRVGFARQAFWNGYGRRQLNRIHPELKHMHQHGMGLKNLIRLGIGFLGLSLGRLFK
ncbi:MAG: glycosyltransferase [Thermoplasmatales archaeon]|nr:MAG: glycosyltransferase [Thermoplasmatales archaeon]